MDYLNEYKDCVYTVDEIVGYLKSVANSIDDYFDIFQDKKNVELLAGAILAQYYTNKNKRKHCAGFVIKTIHKSERPNLNDLFTKSEFEILDNAFDIVVRNENCSIYVQVTRLTEFRNDNSDKSLSELIIQKCLMKRDDKIDLAILLDRGCDFHFEDIKNMINDIEIPYRNVLSIAQEGIDIERGKFDIRYLYPNLKESISILLPGY